jgi:hypothetical protein
MAYFPHRKPKLFGTVATLVARYAWKTITKPTFFIAATLATAQTWRNTLLGTTRTKLDILHTPTTFKLFSSKLSKPGLTENVSIPGATHPYIVLH